MILQELSPLYLGVQQVSPFVMETTKQRVLEYLQNNTLSAPKTEIVKTTYKQDENFLETADLVELHEEVYNNSVMFLNSLGCYDDFRIVSWLNVFDKNAMEQDHYHFSALMSGCYYVDCEPDDSSGCFVIPDQIPQREQYRVSNRLEIVDHHTITPIPGRLIMFESWVRHGVYPNKNSKQRISIAFNIEKTACL
jgi:uncharacterized protein (TIGR02466 family)